MVAIAMTREMGTLGKDVAQGIADQLGLKIIHSELVEHDLAQRLGVEDSQVHRYLEGSPGLLARWKIDQKKLSRYTAEEMLELARGGNVVIRGWGAVAVLRSIPHVLRVRICAPMAFREDVIMKRLGLDDRRAAHREIEQNDAAHARLMRGFFGVNWEDPQLYHVVLNTGALPIESCVRTLRLLTDDPVFQETATSRALLSDKLIQARTRAVMERFTDTPALRESLDVAVADGHVTLSGFALGGDTAGAVAAIREIDGVRGVDSKVRQVATHAYGI